MGVKTAKMVLQTESEAIASLVDRIGPEFEKAERIILDAKGRIIITGLGKSGIIGRKIASTFSSIGIPAFYLHPVEGAHGDIGTIMRGDAAIVISKSGATDELNVILNHLKRLEIPIIAMTGNTSSNLASIADVALDVSVEKEACPYDIVPTASTTAVLALGDALAISLFEEKKLTKEDFAALHPGGSIGLKLTYRVKDLMVSGDDLPLIDIEASMHEVIDIMSEKKLGIAVVAENDKLAGVITDGDLRRLLQRLENPLEINAGEALKSSARENTLRTLPLTIKPEAYAARAVSIMEKHIVTTLVVTNPKGLPVGLIRWIDLSQAGMV
ncbi:MAG: KpsF/GutQ family sugar-phosphate isomerase [Candidatus Latescibacteria bacterium]|jgi:arabinose-5-phosphate isomerase|nr:KpsF/GutQ family sugar-phosphate isomerase [Candidatus Latescibacterota bacterium]